MKHLFALMTGASLLFLSGSLFAEEAQFRLTAAPGITYGEANSFVYYNGNMVSKLDWPLKPVASMDLEGAFHAPFGLFLKGNLAVGIPSKAGTVYDSDYNNQPVNADKTNLSVHDGYLEYSIDTALCAGWTLRSDTILHTPFRIDAEPYISFRYMHLKWTGRNGYYQYASQNSATGLYDAWTDSLAKTNLYGTIIAYEQEYLIPLAGMRVTWHALPALTVGAGIGWTPIMFCNALDNHLYYTKPIDYYDTLGISNSGGIYLEPSVSITWRFSPRTALVFNANWTFISGLKGKTVYRKNDTGVVVSDTEYTGGAAFNAVSARLGIETKLD